MTLSSLPYGPLEAANLNMTLNLRGPSQNPEDWRELNLVIRRERVVYALDYWREPHSDPDHAHQSFDAATLGCRPWACRTDVTWSSEFDRSRAVFCRLVLVRDANGIRRHHGWPFATQTGGMKPHSKFQRGLYPHVSQTDALHLSGRHLATHGT